MSQQTDPTAPFAPRTYQSAWQWNDDETARLMSAEEWLEEEADVDAALAAVDGMDCDSAPNRGGIMLAIAKEIRSLRAERTQWANEFTQQTARLAALTAENERLRGLLAPFVDDEPCRFDHHGNCQTHYVTNPCIVAAARAALPSSRETTDG